MTQIKVNDILTYLQQHNLVLDFDFAADLRDVGNIGSLANHNINSLIWISAKYLLTNQDTTPTLDCALIIAPKEYHHHTLKGVSVIRSTSPKLAFSLVVEHFFSHLLAVPWEHSGRPLHPSSKISKTARLAPGVVIGDGCEIGENVHIGPNTVLAHTLVGDNVSIGANCSIGLPGFGYDKAENGEWFRFPHIGNVIIESGVEIGSNTCIDRGSLDSTVISKNVKIDNLVHIAHNVIIHKNALIIANAMIGGSTTIGAGSWISPSSSLLNKIEIGEGAIVGMGSVVLKNVEPNAKVAGVPAKNLNK